MAFLFILLGHSTMRQNSISTVEAFLLPSLYVADTRAPVCADCVTPISVVLLGAGFAKCLQEG
jgi:hypothetical protein